MAEVDDVVFGLQDRHKNLIYDEFQRLSRQEAIVYRVKGKSNYIRAVKHYRVRYITFVSNIFLTNLYSKINKDYIEIVEKYRANPSSIKTKQQISEITMMCAAIVRDMKITKISFEIKEDVF